MQTTDDQIVWSLYGQFQGSDRPILLNPLQWHGGNQIDNLIEILKFLQSSDIPDKIKILLYRSMCGSGKSASLLHVIEHMGRGIVVVPFKNLQRQYMIDYDKGENKFVLKKDGTKLKVAVMLGRNNFQCEYLKEEYDKQQKLIEEAKKAGQIADVNDFILKTYQIDNTCANRFLPCTRTLKSLGRGRKEARWVVASTCLHPNTDLLTPDGIKKIKDINIGEKIYSVNIKDNEMKVEIDVVKDKIKMRSDSLLRFYNTRTGCDIRVTPNHLMIYRRNFQSEKIHMSSASDLASTITNHVSFIKPFDIVHNHDYVDKIKIGSKVYNMNDFLSLLGWYISEGWMVKKDILRLKDTDQIYDLFIKQSTIKGRYSYCKISQDPTVNEEHFDNIANLLDKMDIRHHFDGYWSFVITDSDVANALIYYGGSRSENKFIHKDIFKLPKEQLKYLFIALIGGDGTIMPPSNKNFESFRYSTVSRKLSDDIMWLSNILGFYTSRSEYIGMNIVYISDYKRYSTENQGTYAGNLKIDKLEYNGYVYDIEVEKNHTYFAGDNGKFVLVHNCPYWIPTPLPREIIYNWQMKTEGKEDIDEFYEEDEEYDYLSSYRKILGIDEGANLDDIDRQFRKLALRCHPDVNKSPWAEEQFKKISSARDILTGKNIISGIGNQQLLKDKLEKEKKCITRLDRIKERLKCSKIEYYKAVNEEDYGVFIRDETDKEGKFCSPVCPYYQQFYSYVNSDVIVMNDAKWNIETRIGRKPLTQVEIFDEGDYWLDRQSETIEIKRYLIDKIYPFDDKIKQIKANTLFIFDNFFNKLVKEVNNKKENIVDAKEYKELFLTIAKCINQYLKYSEDERYEEILIELATIIKYIDRASLSYVQGKREETKIIKVYIPYPDNILKELFKLSSKNIIITSGTMHSNFVLSNLFGINANNYNVHILDGRKDSPGKLFCIKPQTGLARVTYSAYQSPVFKEHYNKTLNYILDQLKIVIDKKTGKQGEGKILVLTPAKKYADGIRNRPDVFVDFAKEKIKEDETTKAIINTSLNDYVDNTLIDIRKIKPTDIQLDGDVYRTPQQIIISTRLVRGADLRDDKCRAIVMTKWPTPDVSDGYFQALLKRFGEKIYWAIIQDKAEREAIQYVSRGLRHDNDWEFFSSPDETAFNRIYTIFREMKLN